MKLREKYKEIKFFFNFERKKYIKFSFLHKKSENKKTVAQKYF